MATYVKSGSLILKTKTGDFCILRPETDAANITGLIGVPGGGTGAGTQVGAFTNIVAPGGVVSGRLDLSKSETALCLNASGVQQQIMFLGKGSSLSNVLFVGWGSSNAQTIFSFYDDTKKYHVWKYNVDGNFYIERPTYLTSLLKVTGEVISTATNAYRAVGGNFGFFIRVDSSRAYFLLTNPGDQYGTFNSLRPLSIALESGRVNMENGVNIDGGAAINGPVTLGSALGIPYGGTGGKTQADAFANIVSPGGTVTGNINLLKDYYVHNATGTVGTAGYVSVIAIKISAGYQNTPMEFRVIQRNRQSTLTLQFENISTADPTITNFSYVGMVNAYAKRVGVGDWRIYIEKSETYDHICITRMEKSWYASGTTVTWDNTVVTDLTGAIRATLGTTITDISGNASTSSASTSLNNYYSSRPTTANIPVTGSGQMIQFKSTSSMTQGSPPAASHMLHFNWDNTGGYDSQIAISNNEGRLFTRGMNAGTWSAWKKVHDNSAPISVTDGGTNASAPAPARLNLGASAVYFGATAPPMQAGDLFFKKV